MRKQNTGSNQAGTIAFVCLQPRVQGRGSLAGNAVKDEACLQTTVEWGSTNMQCKGGGGHKVVQCICRGRVGSAVKGWDMSPGHYAVW